MSDGGRKRRGRATRLRRGEGMAASCALILLGAMFFPWYDATYAGGLLPLMDLTGVGRTAWQTLEVISVLLALAVAVVLGLTFSRLFASEWKPLIAPGAVTAVCGGLATLVILFRIVAPPDLGAVGGIELEATPSLAAFLALAAALGIAYGGYRAMREEGSSFEAVADSLQPRRERPASRRRSRSSSG